MPNQEIHVQLTDVFKIYPGGSSDGTADVHALRDIQLSVPRGEFLSIMGASGSGKSTLLHVLAGLTKPTSGQIQVGGTVLNALSDHDLTLFRREKIGIVFQAFNLIPTLTAEENILLPVLAGGGKQGGKKLSRQEIQDAMERLLDKLQLTSRRKHFPDTLSGGEQQRVAIARALFMDFARNDAAETLFLADEPTGNLDSANSEIVCRLLRELCDERKHTMILVTHEPAVARWTDRVVQLRDGKIVEDFPSNQLKKSSDEREKEE
ncbi:MAG: ABC transporter ATP-binding protein [Planctomycetia bacterium]|nr:ABC transporter ATP-binding protein [Planctomycetia bacterium]